MLLDGQHPPTGCPRPAFAVRRHRARPQTPMPPFLTLSEQGQLRLFLVFFPLPYLAHILIDRAITNFRA